MLNRVRGTQDWLPEKLAHYTHILEVFKLQFSLHHFKEIATPILENRSLFESTAASSDIVEKEMYFVQKRGDGETDAPKYVLRPEGTAPTIRALINEGLIQQTPLKFFYHGPMFRYDRPQKGRLRQFHQIGLEFVGIAEPWADIESITCAWTCLKNLGIAEQVTLELNTIGCAKDRLAYRQALVDYFTPLTSQLSIDSQRRIKHNPLRILDSKDPTDQNIVREAPLLTDFLSAASRTFFEHIQEALERLNIPYTRNPHLVRGLDYYDHTTFEFTTSKLGAQGTILAGGRYNGLVERLGAPPMTGVGWACGIERLMLMCDAPSQCDLPFFLIPATSDDTLAVLELAHNLRQKNIPVDIVTTPSHMAKKIRKINAMNGRYILILGEKERKTGHVVLKDLKTKTQSNIQMAELEARLKHINPKATG